MIKLIRSKKVTPSETHFEVELNGKVVQFSKWVDDDFCTDYEVFDKKTLNLTEDEKEELRDFIEEQRI
jgi:hypothetical protein